MIHKLIILVAAIWAGAAIAQQPPTATVDLSNPVLRQHASLPLNELPHPPILESLQPLVDEQVRNGNFGKTIYTSMHDEDTGFAPSLSAFFQDLTCRADLVLTGTIQNSMSHLTASGAAIYTDYDFQIDTVLKNNPRSPLQQTRHIVITRPGGKLPVAGGFIQYDNQMLLRPRPGRTYLLFLRQIAGTGAYQPAGDVRGRMVFSTLELQPSGTQWRIYRGAYMNRDYSELSDTALRSTIGAASSSCKLLPR
jgi:hypothetical protein